MHHKRFKRYADAHDLYCDIVSGRKEGRKNATIMYVPIKTEEGPFVVYWDV